jgi:hypothetical protein
MKKLETSASSNLLRKKATARYILPMDYFSNDLRLLGCISGLSRYSSPYLNTFSNRSLSCCHL